MNTAQLKKESDMGRIVAFRGYWSGPLSLDALRRDGRGDVHRIGRRKEKARREHISLPSLYGLIAFWYSELVVDESVDENGYRYEQHAGDGYLLRRSADDHQGTEECKSSAYYR